MGFVVNADIEKLAFYALFPENRDNETACHLVMSIAVFSPGIMGRNRIPFFGIQNDVKRCLDIGYRRFPATCFWAASRSRTTGFRYGPSQISIAFFNSASLVKPVPAVRKQADIGLYPAKDSRLPGSFHRRDGQRSSVCRLCRDRWYPASALQGFQAVLREMLLFSPCCGDCRKG